MSRSTHEFLSEHHTALKTRLNKGKRKPLSLPVYDRRNGVLTLLGQTLQEASDQGELVLVAPDGAVLFEDFRLSIHAPEAFTGAVVGQRWRLTYRQGQLTKKQRLPVRSKAKDSA
jgi:hypothetical protein